MAVSANDEEYGVDTLSDIEEETWLRNQIY